MKKNILMALCCCSLLAFTACSDDYNDATSKHVYGENENPYLRVDLEAQATETAPLEVNGAHAYTVNLANYTALFEEKMGMSLDAVLAGLDDGTTVFYPINTTRNQWLKTAYTVDNSGWYFNSANQPCAADDENARATVTLNKDAKTLTVALTEGGTVAGTVLALNVGFAVNGPDYDDYVQFILNVSVTDPTVAVIDITYSEGAEQALDISQYQENIETCFDIPFEDFLTEIASNTNIKFCLANSSTGEWTDMGENYTANPPGYWMNANGEAVAWNTEGFAAYIEYRSGDEDCIVGYNADLASGTTGSFNVGWVDMNDNSKYFHLIVNWTVQ